MTTGAEKIQSLVEELVDALKAHAAVMVADGDPREVMSSINALRTSALAYVQAVFERTGWGNVFADLYDEAEDDDEDADDVDSGSEEPFAGITVLRRFDYAVTDEQAIMEAGRSAYKAVWPDDSDEKAAADVQGLGRALYQIAHAHGWDSLIDVDGLRPVGGTTLVHRQDDPLPSDPDEWPDDMFDTEGEDLYEQSDVFGHHPPGA